MAYIFEYDPQKAQTNRFKHGVTFAEAQTVFDDGTRYLCVMSATQ